MCQNFKLSSRGQYRNHEEFTAECARRRTSYLARLLTPSKSIVVDLHENGLSTPEVSASEDTTTSTFSPFLLREQEEGNPMSQTHQVEDTRQTYFPSGPTLDPGHEFAAPEIIAELTAVAVQRFRTIMTPPSRKRGRSPNPDVGRKRQRRECVRQPIPRLLEPFNGAETRIRSEGFEAHSPAPRMMDRRFWMCPFYVQDSKKNNTCLTRHCLLTTDDVLEHLCLVHREPLFCSVCYETFPAEVDRDVHMRSQSCVHQSSVQLEGITDAQVRKLDSFVSGENHAPHSEVLRWFRIWEIVFPVAGPPEVPFFTTRKDLSVYELRRFWKAEGKGIVSAVLSQRKLRGYQIQDEERNLEALFCLIADCSVDRIVALPESPTKQ